jgi:methylated-DNA-protein-cysteine methyltransferase-like protein
MPAEFRARVITVIERLVPGEVVSYGDVAAQAGFPGAARGVGAVLASSDGLPWWRVVMSTGRLAPGKEADQSRRLRAEGVDVIDGRVRLHRDQPGQTVHGSGHNGPPTGTAARRSHHPRSGTDSSRTQR